MVKHIPGSISKISNKFTVTVSLWIIIYNSLFFICFSKLYEYICTYMVVVAVGPNMSVWLLPTVSITCIFQYHLIYSIDPKYKLVMPKFWKVVQGNPSNTCFPVTMEMIIPLMIVVMIVTGNQLPKKRNNSFNPITYVCN